MKIANDIIRLSVVLLVVGGSAVESTTISDAQASIDKQIETAVSSGVDGLALSLNYVLAPGFQGPAVVSPTTRNAVMALLSWTLESHTSRFVF